MEGAQGGLCTEALQRQPHCWFVSLAALSSRSYSRSMTPPPYTVQVVISPRRTGHSVTDDLGTRTGATGCAIAPATAGFPRCPVSHKHQ